MSNTSVQCWVGALVVLAVQDSTAQACHFRHRNCQRFSPASPFLGVPENAAQSLAEKNPAIDSDLRDITAVSPVELTSWDTYLQFKQNKKIIAEERKEGFVYFAVREMRHIPLRREGGGALGATVGVVLRFKAPVSQRGCPSR
jgi:hypothetical protein